MFTSRPLDQGTWPFPARVWTPELEPPVNFDQSGGDPPRWVLARLHVWTPERLRIIAMRDGNPAVVETIDVAEWEAPDRIRRDSELKVWRVRDTEGRVWTITRGQGCACGHPLKRVNPASL